MSDEKKDSKKPVPVTAAEIIAVGGKSNCNRCLGRGSLVTKTIAEAKQGDGGHTIPCRCARRRFVMRNLDKLVADREGNLYWGDPLRVPEEDAPLRAVPKDDPGLLQHFAKLYLLIEEEEGKIAEIAKKRQPGIAAVEALLPDADAEIEKVRQGFAAAHTEALHVETGIACLVQRLADLRQDIEATEAAVKAEQALLEELKAKLAGEAEVVRGPEAKKAEIAAKIEDLRRRCASEQRQHVKRVESLRKRIEHQAAMRGMSFDEVVTKILGASDGEPQVAKSAPSADVSEQVL